MVIISVEQEEKEGVHFVKFANAQPHEMMLRIRNETETTFTVKQVMVLICSVSSR